jgi:hypothetical protein
MRAICECGKAVILPVANGILTTVKWPKRKHRKQDKPHGYHETKTWHGNCYVISRLENLNQGASTMTTHTYMQYQVTIIQHDTEDTVTVVAVDTQTRQAWIGQTTLRNALSTVATRGHVGMIGYALQGRIERVAA